MYTHMYIYIYMDTHTHSHTHSHAHTHMDCIHICTWIGSLIAVADLLDQVEGH